MKHKIITTSAIGFITLSVLSILSVSVMAFIDPQKVMDLVQVKLTNNDAYSSIRGVFGGVGFTLVVVLLMLSKQRLSYGLWMLALLWGMYSLSRIITIAIEGPLGSFGKQWIVIETSFSIIAIVLASSIKDQKKVQTQNKRGSAQVKTLAA